jgi:predicted nucleic acid-binding Zn finger protein
MSSAYTSILDAALDELNGIIRSLTWAESAVLNQNLVQKQSAYMLTASSYVLCAAIIEEFTRKAVAKLCEEIISSNARHCDLKYSLIGAFSDHYFEAIRNLRDYDKAWRKRLELLSLAASTENPVRMSEDAPLDGKTIRPIHLETIWRIFDLPDNPFPILVWRAALVDVADSRNDIAHGHMTAVAFAKRKGASDTTKKIRRIQDLLTHIALQFSSYIDQKKYLRAP